MSELEPKKTMNREITYRIGWKQGKLKIGENGKVTGAETGIVLMEKAMWLRLLERFVWRATPSVPAPALPVLLWLTPAIGFLATWLLVYLLVRT